MSLVNVTLPSGSGLPAVGSVLWIASMGSPQVYNPIGNLGNQDWAMKAETADTTNQGTAWRQMIVTLRDGGKFTAALHFMPNGGGGQHDGALFDGVTPFSTSLANGLGAVFTSGQTRNYKLVFPDGTVEYMQMIITDFPINMDVTKDLDVKVGFQVVGQPIFA